MRVRHWSACWETFASSAPTGTGSGDMDMAADADGAREADDRFVRAGAGDVGAISDGLRHAGLDAARLGYDRQ